MDNKHARELSKLGASKGGLARAESLTPEERSAIARAAVEVRWERAGISRPLLRATHGSPDRPLQIGDITIPCYVLEGGRRVLVQRETIRALGMSAGGSSYRGGDRLGRFVSQDRLKDFSGKSLAPGTLTPIEFVTTGGFRAIGYEATILPEICEAVLEARRAKRLTKKQLHIAVRCEILLAGLARVGIIALVDEATGYQDDRARNELATILEAFVATELRKWVRTFPVDFYRELFRLKRLPFNGTVQSPPFVGHLVNDIIYARLAPGVLAELKRRNPKNKSGHRRHKLFQWLTEDIGHPKLREHLASVTTMMKMSSDWETFYEWIEKLHKKYKPMPLWDMQGVAPE